jgi:hypothetical protein
MPRHSLLLYLAALFLSSALVASCGGNRDQETSTNFNGKVSPSTAPDSNTAPTSQTERRANPAGYIDRADCNALSGWVLDKDRPEDPVQLELLADGKSQGKFRASAQFRKDLLDAKIGTGNYAFVYPIPNSLKDGSPHAIALKVEGTSYELEFWQNTPRSISCRP